MPDYNESMSSWTAGWASGVVLSIAAFTLLRGNWIPGAAFLALAIASAWWHARVVKRRSAQP